MAYVNLLPWREKQRQYQKQQYLAGLVATAAIVGLVFWFIDGSHRLHCRRRSPGSQKRDLQQGRVWVCRCVGV